MLSPGLTEEMIVLGGFSAKRSEHPTALYQRGWSTGQSEGIDGALAERKGVPKTFFLQIRVKKHRF